jgi:hypothetical protein
MAIPFFSSMSAAALFAFRSHPDAGRLYLP